MRQKSGSKKRLRYAWALLLLCCTGLPEPQVRRRQRSTLFYDRTFMKKNLFISLLAITATLLHSCSSNSSILPNNINGTYKGTWSGRGNSGIITLHNLKQVDDPNSDYDKVEGSVTMLSLANKTISFGEYNPTGNIITIKVNDGANQFTLIASYKASEKSFENGSWLVSGNSGSWSAKK